jgi:hypothetical protein
MSTYKRCANCMVILQVNIVFAVSCCNVEVVNPWWFLVILLKSVKLYKWWHYEKSQLLYNSLLGILPNDFLSLVNSNHRITCYCIMF